MIEFQCDPDLFYVLKAVTKQRDDLQDENAALRRRVAELEGNASLMPFWRRRARHAIKLLAPKPVKCGCTAGMCSHCYTGPVTALPAQRRSE